MKTLKIYNIIASILIVLLAVWVVELRKEIKETNELLDLCAERFYEEVNTE
ncbi:hypothetical protein KSK37_04335 [Kaistella sp. DKR-2]|uniref:hypothetical protein n=1 Tax=Kaistella soli TaxID=2849654 RepID=UPI0015C5F136|nr:hypothetical protein [Kaistella soli]MBU8882308.1 hypothetical protein [Kaistella soli]